MLQVAVNKFSSMKALWRSYGHCFSETKIVNSCTMISQIY